MLSNHSRNFGRLGEVALPALRVGGAARSWLPPSQKKALHTLFGQGIGRFAIEGKTSALPAIFGGRGSVPVVNVKGHGVVTSGCVHVPTHFAEVSFSRRCARQTLSEHHHHFESHCSTNCWSSTWRTNSFFFFLSTFNVVSCASTVSGTATHILQLRCTRPLAACGSRACGFFPAPWSRARFSSGPAGPERKFFLDRLVQSG